MYTEINGQNMFFQYILESILALQWWNISWTNKTETAKTGVLRMAQITQRTEMILMFEKMHFGNFLV